MSPIQSARLPSLDGWRALSIIFVLGSHSKQVVGFPADMKEIWQWIFDSSLGVHFFFVLSGFLITWLMLLENQKTGRISLRHFYLRRGLRILPVYFAFLLVLAGLQAFTSFHQSALSWAGNLTFTTNFVGGSWTSGHLWTLATEEQFYLLWPVLYVLAGGLANVRRLIFILAVPILVAPICRVISYKKFYPPVLDPILQYQSFFNHFDALALGCLGALVYFLGKNDESYARFFGSRGWWCFFAGLVLIMIPYVAERFYVAGAFTTLFGITLQCGGFVLLLLQSIDRPGFLPYRALNWRWVAWIGVLSYSLYIWHMLFCTQASEYGIESVWWLYFPGWLVPAFAVAVISYYGLEKPLFGLRARLRDVKI